MNSQSSRHLVRQGFSVIESLVMLGLLVVFSMVVAAVARKQWQSPDTTAAVPKPTASPSLSAPPPSAPRAEEVPVSPSPTPPAALIDTPAPAGTAGSTPPTDPP